MYYKYYSLLSTVCVSAECRKQKTLFPLYRQVVSQLLIINENVK